MPPRKSHKKSRTGCLRCKQRKVKCDEQHPACGNCTKHGVICDFDDPTAVTPLPARSPSNSGSSVVRYASRSPFAGIARTQTPMYAQPTENTLSHYSASSRATELRLLHNYTTLTSKTLAATNNALTETAWQIYVPTLAFQNPCLMDALLAVSALHMRTITPNDQSLVRLFHGYMASSLSQYTQTLASGVNQNNAEALFTTSALIAFQASASRRFMNEPDDLEAEPYQLPVQWFHSFQGVKTVVLTSWRWLRMSPHVRPIIAAQPALSHNVNVVSHEPFTHLLDDLPAQLEGLSPSDSAETQQAYEHSVAYLNWAHAKPEKPRILGFPATVSRRFIQLIGEQDPRALVIISSFFAMTRSVDDAWWLEGVAKKEVLGILGLLPPDWWAKMEWALLVVNHEGPVTDDLWNKALTIGGAGLSGFQEENSEMADRSPSPGLGNPRLRSISGVGDGGGHIDLMAQIGDAQQIFEVACGRIGGAGLVANVTLQAQVGEMAMVDLLD